MNALSDAERAGLHDVAGWIRDEVEENGHLVDKGIGLHPAFDEQDDIASAMLRGLVLFGARHGARTCGLVPTRAYNGLDLVWSEDGVYRKYRIKKAKKGKTGAFEMLVGTNSVLWQPQAESLIVEEQWVLGYTVSATRNIDEVFAAKVIGITSHKVPHLVFGTIILLGSGSTTPPGKFTSDDEALLPGFEDHATDAGSAAAAA